MCFDDGGQLLQMSVSQEYVVPRIVTLCRLTDGSVPDGRAHRAQRCSSATSRLWCSAKFPVIYDNHDGGREPYVPAFAATGARKPADKIKQRVGCIAEINAETERQLEVAAGRQRCSRMRAGARRRLRVVSTLLPHVIDPHLKMYNLCASADSPRA
jgi:hypothetical protein